MPDEWSYKKAGLDLDAYARTMAGLGPLAQATWDARVVRPPFPPRPGGKGSGGFASLFDLTPPDGRRYKKPILVTCTDGVGSKLKIASMTGKFDTVGIDLVAMSVNDLICTGAEPLTFLDYLAMPKDDPELTTQLVKGVADGCKEAGCSLVGGETAILPDFYAPGDFDMAGFCAGVVEEKEVIDGSRIEVGDVVVGLAASGVHSNGYSLVRKVVFEAAKLSVTDPVPELGATVGEALLTPTRLYAKPVRAVLARYPAKRGAVRGLANVTGGGLIDNLPRVLPPGRRAVLRRGSWPVPPVFGWLQRLGNVADEEMWKVFNMGVGFCVVCDPNYTARVMSRLTAEGIEAWPVGEIVAGEPGVEVV
jgi:phosphoribosylformylglycinamidine cyclo-ligase